MADISKIVLSGVTYNIKDTEARNQLVNLTNVLHLKAVGNQQSSETVEDAISRLDPNPEKGDVVIVITTDGYSEEWVYDGEEWHELGSEGTYVTKTIFEAFKNSLGSLAYKSTASATLTDYATGITGTTYTPSGSITVSKESTPLSTTTSITPGGTVAITKVSSGGTQITGTVTKPTVTISTPTATVTAPTASVTQPTISATTSAVAASYSNETLTFTTGTVSATATGTAVTVGKPGVTISQPTATVGNITFTGDRFSASFTGEETEVELSVNYEKVTDATFTGTQTTITNTLVKGNKIITVS